MIEIHHNFDETKFKWLWARYVKDGDITKHCVNCIPGIYSKKFSAKSNHNLKEQPVILMDEVPDGSYEAIYFCGVVKKGYLCKNIEKNNYRHNVHFAVIPAEGAHDVWDFEDWHVEIENGKLERIPPTYELGDRFFQPPYSPHFYTCRIFRWMVGHFYPQELRNITYSSFATLEDPANPSIKYPVENVIKMFIDIGYDYAEWAFEFPYGDCNADVWYLQLDRVKGNDEVCVGKARNYILKNNLFDRKTFFNTCVVHDWMVFDRDVEVCDTAGIPHTVQAYSLTENFDLNEDNLFRIGVNEFLDMIAPYQDRDLYFDPRIELPYDNANFVALLERIYNSRN